MIYLTASSNSSTLERAKLTAPSAYLLKLFEDRKLETTIPIALYKHQLEEELRESEGRFRTLVEHAPEAIVVFDADLNCFVDANGSAEHLFALKREALLRVGPLEVSPPFQPDGRLSSEATRPRWQEEPKETGHCIELVTDLEAVPPIRAAQAGLYDILVNLIFNAVDALPRGGNIRICSRALEEGVQLTISDTGAGMDEKTQQRIFEPFFTTKKDVGSGLGLFTVYGTMTRWGGSIEVESAVKRGTQFTLCFPIWDGLQKNGGNPHLAVRRGS